MPKINAVYLYAGDLDRSIAFYRDLLGIPLERHATDPQWAEAHLEGGIRFALHASGERLRAAGTRVGPIEREDWGESVEVFDPDGYVVELFRPPASQQPAAS